MREIDPNSQQAKEEKNLAKLAHVIQILMDGNPTFPLSICYSFLSLCQHETLLSDEGGPITVRELAKRLGQSYATMTRHIRYLEKREKGSVGPPLIATHEWQQDRRQRIISLSPQGERLKRRVINELLN